MNIRLLPVFVLLTCLWLPVIAQDTAEQTSTNTGRFSGNLEANGNFFIRDSFIGAFNIPQYDRQLFGADTWLNLNYSNWGFDVGVRFDMFNNSNLLNPNDSYTDMGIGRWYVSKSIHKLDISAGYLYDIIGSGIIFRAYEERPLAIDQALFGLRLAYELTPNWKVKVFTGRQKRQLDEPYKSVIRGIAIDGFVSSDSSGISFAPGFGIVSRTLDDQTMQNLVSTIDLYQKQDIFVPKYSAYAASLYNTLTAGPITWYVEAAVKSKDAFFNPFKERVTVSEDTIVGRYESGRGSVFYTSLSYANKGWGITLEGKRTEHFDFRTSPLEEGNRGLLHYIPPMTRVNTYRVLARYAAATQFVGEQAFQADIRYAINKDLSLNVNFSYIDDLKNTQLYRELYTEMYYKYKRKWTLTAGLQLQRYNQDIYQGKPGALPVETITPFVDFLYKFDRKKALRIESQYMTVAKDDNDTRADYGNWLHGMAEFTIAPHWVFSASDMFNISPGKLSPINKETGERETIHFQRFDVIYTFKSNRFSLSYVKQPEGVVCSGGICRLEPAFNGVKMTVNSTF